MVIQDNMMLNILWIMKTKRVYLPMSLFGELIEVVVEVEVEVEVDVVLCLVVTEIFMN